MCLLGAFIALRLHIVYNIMQKIYLALQMQAKLFIEREVFMNFIALFFLCVRMFHFIHSHKIAYLLQRFSRILDERRANPGRKQVIIIDGSATTFIIYFLLDVVFLLYCIWLMLHDATWTPGFLLLVIAALESFAIHARISGAYDEDEEGFVYPRTWLRYLCFGESMFILLRLFEGA